MDKQCIRAYIKTRFLLGLTATQIHGELTGVYGSDVVSYRTICFWIQRFAVGRESLEDNPQVGRPISIITRKNIDAVNDLVQVNPHISIDYITFMLDMSYGSVDTILRQDLKLRKISSRWIPHELTDEQRKRRVEICIEN